jgi:ATP-dependent DNA ligase
LRVPGLPTRGAWRYEVKWDGFRAIVLTGGRCVSAAEAGA